MSTQPSWQTTQAELGTLISTSGKLRMLSHRAVMFALLSRDNQADAETAHSKLKQAVAEFRQITNVLNGRDSQQLDAAIRFLEDNKIIPEEHLAALDRFLLLADRITDNPSMAEIASLADFVSNPLLAALNELNVRIREALEQLTLKQQESDKRTKALISSSVTEIEKVSMSIRLIALNASVEAKRAGDHGHGFNVIAAEVQRLSESTSLLLGDLKVQLRNL